VDVEGRRFRNENLEGFLRRRFTVGLEILTDGGVLLGWEEGGMNASRLQCNINEGSRRGYKGMLYKLNNPWCWVRGKAKA
jgi:hypothetical protein